MLRLPRGVSPGAGSGGAALPPHHHQQQQQQQKAVSVMGSAERVASSLGSPPVPSVPAGYFTQVYSQAAVSVPAPGGGCLYTTPQGPELRSIRSASAGRLPAKRKLDLESPSQPCHPEFRTPKGKGRTLAQVPSPRTPKSPGEKTRYDTSLGLLTKKFIHLLSESADGVLDLNRAAEVLEVQKRRIYDITNVLEGIQLIRKKSKNHIQWMGTGIFEDTSVTAKQQVLREELAELAKTERTLDQLLQDCALQLKQLTDDEANQRLAYVTYQDLRAISNFQEQTVIAVKAPPETRLEVPDFNEDNLQLHLRSTNGPIEVYLCPEEIPEDSPAKETSSSSTTSPRDRFASSPEKGTPGAERPAPRAMLAWGAIGVGCQPCSSPSLPLAPPAEPPRPALVEVEEGLLGSPQHLLQQTEDQLPCAPSYLDSGPFVAFSPPLDQDDYLWGLEGGEGVSDLFEAYDLGDLLKN
ncbi:LOW QUALITY PROTEIN: transcription factor E2F2 [Rhea pennata]|uniref:LOW QUALITY PROTEIN: transcription factor E2F2 n=1 Tax=Rhea pennata TaxID=8795 RepID=UPI002E262A0E